MKGFGSISMFKKRVLEGVFVSVVMFSVFVILVIASFIYAFNMMLSLDVNMPLKVALCFIPIGFATFVTSKILYEILDLGVIANNIASSEYPIDFFEEDPRKSLAKYCRLIQFSAEDLSYLSYYCSQEKFSENYVGRPRR